MYSGKSEELMRRVRRALIAGRRVEVFKSSLDDRYGGIGHVSSHDGLKLRARPVADAGSMLAAVAAASAAANPAEVVAVDEVHFLEGDVAAAANQLADSGCRVILAGLDMDFRGDPFPAMSELLAVAEQVLKLHAICMKCGAPATRNQRLIDGRPAHVSGPTVQVGGPGDYEARCRACHETPGGEQEVRQR